MPSKSSTTVDDSTPVGTHRLTRNILLSMAAAILFGCLVHWGVKSDVTIALWIERYFVQGLLALTGEYFIRALKMVVVPLVVFSIIAGIAGQRDANDSDEKLGFKMAATFGLYLVTTIVAIVLALSVAAVIDPGQGSQVQSTTQFEAPAGVPLLQVLAEFMPTNIIAAFAGGNMIAIIVVSLVLALGMNQAGAAGARVASLCCDINEVILHLVSLIMATAPIGVFALVMQVFTAQGLGFMASIAGYFLTVVLVLVLHGALVYSALVRFGAGIPIVFFWKQMRQAMLFAFSTASSAATISITLQTLIERFKVPKRIASVTIPLGATINMDGTAIMQGVAVVFIAGVYGIDLSLFEYVQVVMLATLASIGTAAVPSAGLITLAVVLVQVKLPAEAIGLIIGVDRLLDMLRTALNVAGDAAVTLTVSRPDTQTSLE